MLDMNKRHEQDLKNMQLKIHTNTDDAFNKFKEATREMMTKQMVQPLSNKQVCGLMMVQPLSNKQVCGLMVQSPCKKQCFIIF